MAIRTHLQEAHPMLVLSRKIGESICIGDDVVVTVVQIDGNKIRLGIEAPRSVPIWRSELIVKEEPEGESLSLV
jgi:carbon storage regulator